MVRNRSGAEGSRCRAQAPACISATTDDGSGLHHMVYEVVDKTPSTKPLPPCQRRRSDPQRGYSVDRGDDGRGIPVDIHIGRRHFGGRGHHDPVHAGGKFDQNSYKVSGGLHGVGVLVVNALSSKTGTAGLARRQGTLQSSSHHGDAVAPLIEVGEANASAHRGDVSGLHRDLHQRLNMICDAGTSPARNSLS